MQRTATALLAGAIGICVLALMPSAKADAQPAFVSVSAATPSVIQSASPFLMAALPPSAPAPLGFVGTSVMPGGPVPGETCSVDNPAGGQCSALAAGQRCSAFNDGGNTCSASGFVGSSDNECSAFAANAACSVLPPQSTAGQFSFCSALQTTGDNQQRCSAMGTASNQRCSTKGAGLDFCSTLGNGQPQVYDCSVLNVGATERSFCSTKFNQPAAAKGCSTYPGPLPGADRCSVALGGKGICTTFGAADPNSCSAFLQFSHCSVIGGPAGNPCVQ